MEELLVRVYVLRVENVLALSGQAWEEVEAVSEAPVAAV